MTAKIIQTRKTNLECIQISTQEGDGATLASAHWLTAGMEPLHEMKGNEEHNCIVLCNWNVVVPFSGPFFGRFSGLFLGVHLGDLPQEWRSPSFLFF